MNDIIDSFRGKNNFLSNFHPCNIAIDGYIFPSVENAFQAKKAVDLSLIKLFEKDTAKEAKARGNEIQVRADWGEIKKSYMKELLIIKFHDVGLATKLLLTGDAKLIEGNWWHDNYWGKCTCSPCGILHDENSNTLGKLLMQVRTEIATSSEV